MQQHRTSNLDSVKSADCLERMVALIGLPMFVPLLRPEQNGGVDALIFVSDGISVYQVLLLLGSGAATVAVCGAAGKIF